jgi:hypothetical protein
MRTKTLLLAAAAALAAGILSSSAQVYSANVVGYINIQLTNGFTMVANQLDFDGTGTNNNILTAIGTNLPPSSKVEAYDPTLPGFRSVTLSSGHVWSSGSSGPYVTAALQPGAGVFVFIPGVTPTNVTLTLTGTVLQQTNVTSYPSQFQIASSLFPISGNLTTNLNYIPNPKLGSIDDTVEQWNQGSQSFVTHKYNGTSWSAGSPSLAVGESFFLIPNQTTSWTNGFSVQ